MFFSIRYFTVVFLAVLFLSGCSSTLYHDYVMSGQIVSVEGQEVVVCFSNTSDLKSNEIVRAYRVVYEYDAVSEGEPFYERRYVGTVRIGENKDGHFTKATIVSGELEKYDMVEFSRK